MKLLGVFDIALDCPKRVYTAGSSISGSVVVQLSADTHVSCLAIQVLGVGEVFWTNRSTIDTSGNVFHPAPSRFIRNHRNKETYLKIRRVLYESKDDSTICAGPHTFQFSVALPEDLPSSLQAGYGKIRYSIKATISRPWKLTDEEVKRSFTVIGITDLNKMSNIMYPQSGAVDIATRGCLSKSGSIQATLRIDRRGYVPGENINLEGEVANISNKPLKSTRVQLRMVLTFRSNNKITKRVVRVISSSKRGEVEPKGVETWTGKKLHIPPLPPSPLSNCNIMSVAYYIVLMVEPSRYSGDFEVPINILIGTVPLQNLEPDFSTSSVVPNNTKSEQKAIEPNIMDVSPDGVSQCYSGLKEEDPDEHPETQYMPVFSYFAINKDENQESSDENT